jgi:hypothetical protein
MRQGCWADGHIGGKDANGGMLVREWAGGAVASMLLISALLGSMAAVPASAQSSSATGTVKFFVDGDAGFSTWLEQPTEDQKQFMRDNYYRMQTYAPYFDSRLSWYPNAWDYQDAYAMHLSGSLWAEHPEWVLKDADGNYLYIPFGCNGNSCPQYAGDIGNPAFRAHWIDTQRVTLQAGYIGLWIDDVNMASIKVGNGSGNAVTPIDPRTAQPMTLADWRRYFAEFMEDIRAAFPAAELVHNVHWWADTGDAFVARQLLAADYINLERGITDGGITRGTGKFSFETFIALVDWLHVRGKQIILDDDDDSGDQERDYELAFYHLVNNGGDLLGADGDRGRMTPGNFWSGYSLDLGAAAGGQYRWNELFRRDFACGMVLVNQPGMPSISVDLVEPFTTLEGQSVTAVTLPASSGQILSKTCDPGGGMDPIDDDNDGLENSIDNCPNVQNTELFPDTEGWAPQQDDDGDGIGNACDLVIPIQFIPAATVGNNYSHQLTVLRCQSSCTWTMTSGFLPAGLTIDSAGLISGVPTAGSFTATFAMQVMDSTGDTATRVMKIRAKISGCYSCHVDTTF